MFLLRMLTKRVVFFCADPTLIFRPASSWKTTEHSKEATCDKFTDTNLIKRYQRRSFGLAQYRSFPVSKKIKAWMKSTWKENEETYPEFYKAITEVVVRYLVPVEITHNISGSFHGEKTRKETFLCRRWQRLRKLKMPLSGRSVKKKRNITQFKAK